MKDIDISSFKWGIEHEFPVVNAAGEFCDFSNSTFEDFNRVIEEMPTFDSDYPGLRVGDLGIKAKRWYIEGFERFDEEGTYLLTDPKGFEIRTPISSSIEEAVATLKQDFASFVKVAAKYGYTPASVSLNPLRDEFVPNPALNSWEVAHRRSPEERTAYIHMLTSGPDISFSSPLFDVAKSIDIAQKLTFYSPYIVPFSFSSPFYKGELWGGLSKRTYYRTGKRPSVLVFVGEESERIKSTPTLTDKARLAAEVGRIEFKAFDTVRDLDLYLALGTLLLGIALDDTLEGRLIVPNEALHKHSATHGFKDALIHNLAEDVVQAAENALPPEYRANLAPLHAMLQTRRSQADDMIEQYQKTRDILSAI
jgi:hypothetical protein